MIMKTKSMLFAALLVVSAAATAFGKDEPSKAGLTVIPVKGSEIFRVIYKGESTGKVKVNIFNANSKMIFSETINDTKGFILPLNFRSLEFGEYTLELTDASGKRIELISHQPTKSLENIRISRLSNAEDKFLLSVANAGSETITVKIFDTYHNLVHTGSIDITGNFAQVYSFKNLSGSCTFEVSDNSGKVKTAQF